MRNSEPQPRSRRGENAAARAMTNAAVALLPVLACFLGGATQKWGEAIVVAILGLCLLIRPPRLSLGIWINCVLLGLVVLATISFLPHSWFFVPSWRTALVSDFDIQ